MAWDAAPIRSDGEMGMRDVIEALRRVVASREACENAMARSTTPRHRRDRRAGHPDR
jgi:hypothetical protein